MNTIVTTQMVKIGKSQGSRIPKPLLEQVGLSGMVQLEVEADCLILSLIEEIQSAAKNVQTAFPNANCQKVARTAGIDCQSLVSDLDTYFYDVWSPGNGVRKLSQKPKAWLCDLQADLQQSFFERYPRYAALEAVINPEDTPSLARRLAAIDALRQCLLIYLAELL